MQARLNTLEEDRKTIMLQVGVRARVEQLKIDREKADETSSIMYVACMYQRCCKSPP